MTTRPKLTQLHTPGELALAALVAAIIGATTTTYAAAHLTALLAGRRLDATLADAFGALLRLPGTWRHPARGWPPDTHAALGNTTAFYLGFLVSFGAHLGAVAAFWRLWRKLTAPQHPLGVDPDHGLARPKDLRNLWIRRPVPGRLTLGTVGGRLIAAEPDVSLAVIGPTGCGKTIGFVIPALHEWTNGPVICTSVKNDLLDATLHTRRQLGTVWIFDPTNTTGHPTARWNPLATCTTYANATQTAAWMTSAAPSRRATLDDADHWETQARKALAALLLAAAHGGHTMRDLARWVDLQEERNVRTLLLEHAGVTLEVEQRLAGLSPDQCAARHDDTHADVVAELLPTGALDPLLAVEFLWDLDDRIKGSVYTTLQNILLAYTDPTVADATSAGDNQIDLDHWLSGPNTIYVTAPATDQQRLRPVFTTLLEQAVRHAYTTATRNGGRLQRPCLVLLDEAANIAPARNLPEWASTARSHAITLVTVWQDLAQINATYGRSAPTVLNNHLAKWFGTGLADLDALNYISGLLGDTETVRASVTRSTGSGRQQTTVGDQHARRPLGPPSAVRRQQMRGGLLFYGRNPPAQLSLRPTGSAA